jgi:hypothetical protein
MMEEIKYHAVYHRPIGGFPFETPINFTTSGTAEDYKVYLNQLSDNRLRSKIYEVKEKKLYILDSIEDVEDMNDSSAIDYALNKLTDKEKILLGLSTNE